MYAKLQQFQDRLLENYQTPQIDYSTSDYHHAATQPLTKSFSRASMPPGLGQQHASRFSLLQPGAYQNKRVRSHSAHARQVSNAVTEATEESYDPFRPSRTRIAPAVPIDQSKITVLRNTSRAASRPPSSRLPSRGSARHPTITELQAEDSMARPTSASGTRSPGYEKFRKMSSNQRRISRGNSRITMVSNRSGISNTSSVVFRKSASYRRNVTFPHQHRKISGESRLRSVRRHASHLTLYQRYMQGELAQRKGHGSVITHSRQPFKETSTSSQQASMPVEPVLNSPRKRSRLESPVRQQSIKYCGASDARKVSHELARLCDETWNRDSVASTAPTAGTEFRQSQHSYHTRATSISVQDMAKEVSLPPSREGFDVSHTFQEDEVKPLPPPASEKPSSSAYIPSGTRREIARTREVLKQRARDSCIPPGALDDVISHLDRLMQPSNVRLAEEQKRAASTPDPSIPRKDTFEQIMGDANIPYRSATEPTNRKRMSTIRLVEDSEADYKCLDPIQPLTIRKKSSSSGPSSGSRTPTQQKFNPQQFSQNRVPSPTIPQDQGLDAIEETSDKENFDPVGRKHGAGGDNKRRWFRRYHAPQRSREIETGPPLPPKDDIRLPHHQRNSDERQTHKKSKSTSSKPPLSTKKSFLNLFKGKKDRSPVEGDYDIDDSASQSTETSSNHHRSSSHDKRNVSGSTTIVHHKHSQSSLRTHLNPQPTNWLARFFRLKPATQVLCFQVSKPRARREISAAFYAWRKYGMRDIVITKGPLTTIRARVDADNSLHIPPMRFVCEIHEVLFKGRRAGLSVARLMQEKGAKASFERVAGALADVLREKGVLVEDKRDVEEMRRGVAF